MDIALNKTGIAVVSADREVLCVKLLITPPKLTYYEKISFLFSEYIDFFSLYKNSILILEGRLQAGWSGATLASIEGARVACYLAFHYTRPKDEKYEVVDYSPREVKKFVAGKGNASKEDLRIMSSQFSWSNIVTYQEDIYDALFLIMYHLHKKGRRKGRSLEGD